MNHEFGAIAGAQFGMAIADHVRDMKEEGFCPLCMIAAMMAVLAPQFINPEEEPERVCEWLEGIATSVMLNWKKDGTEAPSVTPDKRTMN